jgi:hypothetical protein
MTFQVQVAGRGCTSRGGAAQVEVKLHRALTSTMGQLHSTAVQPPTSTCLKSLLNARLVTMSSVKRWLWSSMSIAKLPPSRVAALSHDVAVQVECESKANFEISFSLYIGSKVETSRCFQAM